MDDIAKDTNLAAQHAMASVSPTYRTLVQAVWKPDQRLVHFESTELWCEGRHDLLLANQTDGAGCVLKRFHLVGNFQFPNILREVKLLRRFANHPNIVFLRGCFLDGPNGYLEFNRYDMDLADWARTAGPAQDVLPVHVLESFRCAASAVVHIHGANFVHGDIKPQNCLSQIDARGCAQPLLCDFETVRELETGDHVTKGASILLTRSTLAAVGESDCSAPLRCIRILCARGPKVLFATA